MSTLEALQSQIASGLRDTFTEKQRAKMVADLAETLGVTSIAIGSGATDGLTDEVKEKVLRDVAARLGVPVSTSAELASNLAQIRNRMENAETELSAARQLIARLS